MSTFGLKQALAQGILVRERCQSSLLIRRTVNLVCYYIIFLNISYVFPWIQKKVNSSICPAEGDTVQEANNQTKQKQKIRLELPLIHFREFRYTRLADCDKKET